jgi:hypothetical protein
LSYTNAGHSYLDSNQEPRLPKSCNQNSTTRSIVCVNVG